MTVVNEQKDALGKTRMLRNAKSRTKKHSPDLVVARTFLDCFDGLITFQTFADQERLKRREIANTPENYAKLTTDANAKLKWVRVDPFARVFDGSLDDHVDKLLQLNAEGAGIFFAVNEMDGRGRKLDNLKRVRAVWADLDGVPLPDQWPLAPSILVESSPGKFHVYWLLSAPAWFWPKSNGGSVDIQHAARGAELSR
jgi:hypothetical protein